MQLDFQKSKDGKSQGVWIGIMDTRSLKKPAATTTPTVPKEPELTTGQLALMKVKAKMTEAAEAAEGEIRSLRQARLDALSTRANGEISKLAISTASYFLLATAGFGVAVCAPVACVAGYYLYRSLGTVGEIEKSEEELTNHIKES